MLARGPPVHRCEVPLNLMSRTHQCLQSVAVTVRCVDARLNHVGEHVHGSSGCRKPLSRWLVPTVAPSLDGVRSRVRSTGLPLCTGEMFWLRDVLSRLICCYLLVSSALCVLAKGEACLFWFGFGVRLVAHSESILLPAVCADIASRTPVGLVLVSVLTSAVPA